MTFYVQDYSTLGTQLPLEEAVRQKESHLKAAFEKHQVDTIPTLPTWVLNYASLAAGRSLSVPTVADYSTPINTWLSRYIVTSQIWRGTVMMDFPEKTHLLIARLISPNFRTR